MESFLRLADELPDQSPPSNEVHSITTPLESDIRWAETFDWDCSDADSLLSNPPVPCDDVQVQSPQPNSIAEDAPLEEPSANAPEENGELHIFVLVLVCVCVRARVCVWERETISEILFFPQ